MKKVMYCFGSAEVVACLSLIVFYNLPYSGASIAASLVLCLIALLIAMGNRHLRHFELLSDTILIPPISNSGVYLVGAGDGRYKIGKSTNIDNRLYDLANASPLKLTLEHVIPCKNMTAGELYLHELFATRRIHGEWFKLSPVDVSIIKRIETL